MARTNLAFRWLGVLALGSLLGAACGERDSTLEQSINLMDAPIALQGELVFIDRNDRAFLLDVSGRELAAEAKVVALPHAPKLAARRNGKGKAGNEVLVLTGGRRASDDERAQPAMLVAIEADGGSRRYTLGNPFDRMEQSDDGRYVFLFKSGGNSERLLDNPNEIAIVDLNKGAKDKGAVTLRTLRSFEDTPLSVVYSPPMSLLGETRRLAIVLSHKNVTLIDLDHLDRRETTVQLSGVSGSAVEPAQVTFDPKLPKLYVRGAASNDVFVFNLSERPGGTKDSEGGESHNDFRPSIDQLGVGALPSDMSLYESPGGTRLLVLSADSLQASIVSATAVTDVPLEARARQVMIFEAPSPRDHNSAPRALLYDDMGSTLQFLDLSDIEERGKRNLEVVDLPSPIVKLVPMPGEQRVLVLHDQGVSLIDLAGRTVSPLSSDRMLEDAEFDAERHNLWVGPAEQPFVGWLELGTGDTHELLLDDNIERLVPMFDSGQVAVVHASSVGYVTLLDARKPTREGARSVRGFLIAGLLDRGE